MILTGRARIVPVRDVDTDMIFHNRHLHITKPEEMKSFIFGNLKGFEQFPTTTKPGDILIVGHNFGCGSSRQQAVDGFMALGVAGLVAESIGAIYKRNAINAGWPLIEASGICDCGIIKGELIEVNLEEGSIRNSSGALVAKGKPMTDVQREIYQAGGILKMM
jgi:3-isopropylmalate/(R)-2-methylmalate dehydratase small subunit